MKSARSVAIFSLKLKERRAREAERVAKEKAEEEAQEKVWKSFNEILCFFVQISTLNFQAMMIGAMCGGGGELNLIPLENLIRIEDVEGGRRSSNSQQHNNNSSSGT